jgi:hypothetical protein
MPLLKEKSRSHVAQVLGAQGTMAPAPALVCCTGVPQ